MNHLSHHFNLFEATHFVLTGESAGGFGVRKQINSTIFKFKLNPSKITFPSNNQTSQFKTIKNNQVGLNCDDVADWLHANNPNMLVLKLFKNGKKSSWTHFSRIV